MWIVRLALRRPYTFVVVALLIVVLGAVSMSRMPTDIFPDVDIPVVSVVWSFTGISPEEMERRMLTPSERAFTDERERHRAHRVADAWPASGVIRIYFQPGAKIEAAVAQVVRPRRRILRALPPGMSPPLIIRYSASSVPILQLVGRRARRCRSGSSSTTRRTSSAPSSPPCRAPRSACPTAASRGRSWWTSIPRALKATGSAARTWSNAISAQNLILPTGTAKIGAREYSVRVNSSPDTIEALNDLPIKQVNGAVVYIRDVAQVRDGFAVQTNIVQPGRPPGQPASRSSRAAAPRRSTSCERSRTMLPRIQATLPPELELKLLFDQSVFVRAAVDGVVREASIAAGLTALMILLFLGSWRSTLIVAVSIPLSILTSMIVLRPLGRRSTS